MPERPFGHAVDVGMPEPPPVPPDASEKARLRATFSANTADIGACWRQAIPLCCIEGAAVARLLFGEGVLGQIPSGPPFGAPLGWIITYSRHKRLHFAYLAPRITSRVADSYEGFWGTEQAPRPFAAPARELGGNLHAMRDWQGEIARRLNLPDIDRRWDT